MIKLEKVSKIYKTKDKKSKGIIDVSLSLPKSGLIAVVGPSGCGKTTLLNILGGLDSPTSGEFYYNSLTTSSFKESDWNRYRNQDIGFIYQNFFLMQHLTVLENISLGLFIQNKDSLEIQEKTILILNQVNLFEERNKKPNELSGGQQQRAAIARAIIHNPSIILADEPTGSLDEDSSIDIMNILKDLSKDKLVIVVTHNKNLAEDYADQIIRMKDNKIVSVDIITRKTDDEVISSKSDSYKTKLIPFVKLAIHNLFSKKFRTVILALAASISVIGISLVIALSRGFNLYMDKQKKETLTVFPLRVESTTFIVPSLDPTKNPSVKPLPDIDYALPYNLESLSIRQNDLTYDYYEYVKQMPNGLLDYTHYNYGLKTNFIINNNSSYYHFDVIDPLGYNLETLYEFYEPIYGGKPLNNELGLIIVVDRYNRLPKDLIQYLGFTGNDNITFEELLNLKIRWAPNDVIYENIDINKYGIVSDLSSAFLNNNSVELPVLTILRMKDSQSLDAIYPGIFYSNQLTQQIISSSSSSEIVDFQKNSNINVLTNQSVANLDSTLRRLGYATYPNGYLFYPLSLETKDLALAYLREYNNLSHVNFLDRIEPFDLAGVGLATLRVGIDSVSSLLMIFAVLSLVITNILLGLITYHSVLERTREIGILRSLGSSKSQVGFLFYFEAIFLSLLASILGIIISYLLLPLANYLFYGYTSIRSLGVFYFTDGLLIVVLAVFLSGLFSLIPAVIASKKQPIDCLRVE